MKCVKKGWSEQTAWWHAVTRICELVYSHLRVAAGSSPYFVFQLASASTLLATASYDSPDLQNWCFWPKILKYKWLKAYYVYNEHLKLLKHCMASICKFCKHSIKGVLNSYVKTLENHSYLTQLKHKILKGGNYLRNSPNPSCTRSSSFQASSLLLIIKP
jgi:hypothetical protein